MTNVGILEDDVALLILSYLIYVPEYKKIRMPEKLSDRTICSKCGLIGSKELNKCSLCHSITYCGEECEREDLVRHRDNCIPVMVTELAGKGRGLVASRDIKVGDVIFNEQAAVSVYDDDRNWTKEASSVAFNKSVKIVKDQVKSLPKEKKSQFYKLSPQCDADTMQEMEKFSINCIADESSLHASVHLFLIQSLINHSCSPNAATSFKKDEKTEKHITIFGLSSAIVVYFLSWDLDWFWKIFSSISTLFIYLKLKSKWKVWRREKKHLVVRAIKKIQEGEEINLCYLGYDENLGSKHQMKQHLKTEFKFDCKCSICIGGKYLGSLKI